MSKDEQLIDAADFLQEIYRAMPGALLVFDGDGAVQSVNEAGLLLFGYSEAELVGSPALPLFAPGQLPDFRALASSTVMLREEKNCRSNSGAHIPVLLSARALGRSPDGKPRGVVCVMLDLREQKRLELELRQAQKLESVGRLASGIAHEINTPVQFVSDSVDFVSSAMADLSLFIRKQTQALQQLVAAPGEGEISRGSAAEVARQLAALAADLDVAYLEEHVPKALARSVDGLDRIARIVRSMKEFAHPDRKEKSMADINKAVESTLVIATSETRYVADLRTEFFADLPPVNCLLSEVNQVVLNIVVNAAQAIGERMKTTRKKGEIVVRTRQLDHTAEISISDNGGGIPLENRERIFDPFFTTKEVGKGTGQGLAIARAVIVEKHGGELTFETEEGKGTTFFIRLPL